MKRIAGTLAILWAVLFAASAVWLNDVPRKKVFEIPQLVGAVNYGFPLAYGWVDFESDSETLEPLSRFVHANTFRFRMLSAGALGTNVVAATMLALLNLWGVYSICRDSTFLTIVFGLLWSTVIVVGVLYVAGRMPIPVDREFTLLDEAAMTMCVVWLALGIVSLHQIVEALTRKPFEGTDR